YSSKVIHLCTTIYHFKTNWILHERISSQNPKRRKYGTKSYKPYGHKVKPLRQFIPPKYPNTKKRRLQKECKQSFNRKRRPKYIPDKPKISKQIHTKLKLLKKT